MLKRALRWLVWIFGGFLVAGIALFLISILINLTDVPLNTEAQALMVAPKYVADPNQNAYFVLWAMDADEGLDALKIGREVDESYQQLYQENPSRNKYEQKDGYKKGPKSSWDMRRCDQTVQNCIEADLRNRVQLDATLSQNILLLRRYELIQQLPQFEEHPIPALALPFPGYVPLAQASNMALTKAVFDIADGRLKNGVDQITKNDQSLRRLLQKTSTLISRMVVLAMLRRQARTISELTELYPSLVEQYGDQLSYLARPLGVDEQSFSAVYANEARLQINLWKNIGVSEAFGSYWSTNDEATTSDRMLGKIFSLLYQPNGTTNLFAAWWLPLLQKDNQPASGYANLRERVIKNTAQLNEHSSLPFLHFLSNPIGKMAFMISANPDTYLSYMERSVDVDGYLRLVGLQIDLRRKKLPESAIRNYAIQAGPLFRRPYYGKPMTWVADKKQLQFIGRQAAAGNVDEKNIFIVQLR